VEATLLAYVKRDHDSIPILRMMRLSQEEIGERAATLAKAVLASPSKFKIEIIDGESVIGGGAAPSSALPTCVMALTHAELNADDLSAFFRKFRSPIIARVEEGHVLLDLRTVFPEQDTILAEAIRQIA